MLLVLVAGKRGAGKSLFAEVGKELGIPSYEMSQNIVELMLKTDILISNFSLREFSDALRKEKGKDAVAKLMCAKLKKEEGAQKAKSRKCAIILGVRSQEEVSHFVSQGFEIITAAIIADEKIRFSRIQARRRPEDAKTLEDFRWADNIESGWGLGEVLEQAEFKVENEGTAEQAKYLIRSFLSRASAA